MTKLEAFSEQEKKRLRFRLHLLGSDCMIVFELECAGCRDRIALEISCDLNSDEAVALEGRAELKGQIIE